MPLPSSHALPPSSTHPTGGELSVLSVDPSPDGDCEGHKKATFAPSVSSQP